MKDKIEVIPKTMEKFFGCSGQMVKPSADTVKAIVGKIHKGKLITLDQLRRKLASDFGVDTACPASTTKALKILAKEDKPVCYWRVVKKNGELIAMHSNGIKRHVSLLESDGLEIDHNKKTPAVLLFEAKLSKIT